MDKVIFGLGVTGLGMVVVFAGLTVLIGFILLLNKFTKGKPEQKPQAAVSQPEPTPIAASNEEASDALPPETVAAITAAIACIWDKKSDFRVCRIKRINNAPAWNRAGREEQTYSHI